MADELRDNPTKRRGHAKARPLEASDYATRLKLIRPFVSGFRSSDGYDIRRFHDPKYLSSSKKREINRYFDHITLLTGKANYLFRPRRKDHLEAAKRATGSESFKRLKLAVIQVPTIFSDVSGEREIVKPDVSFTASGAMRVKVGNRTRETLLFSDYGFDATDIARDPVGVAKYVLEQSQRDFKYYALICGESLYGKGRPKMMLPHVVLNEVQKLVNNYGADKYNENDPSSHYFGNWMFGLIGHDFKHLNEVQSYTKAYRAYREKRDKIKKKIHALKQQLDRYDNALSTMWRSKRYKSEAAKNKRRDQIEREKQRIKREIAQLLVSRSKI